MELWIQVIIIGTLILANIVIIYISHRRRERKIDDLILYLMKVQDNMELPTFDSMNGEDLEFSEVRFISWLFN